MTRLLPVIRHVVVQGGVNITTSIMMMFWKRCSCFRSPSEEQLDEMTSRTIDFSHGCLEEIPPEVFAKERTLEVLKLDSNQIRELPRQLFHLTGLKVLTLSDNELQMIPKAINTLINLEILNISKNSIPEIPESIKICRSLKSIDVSVNPLGKLPDGFTQLINLNELYLNDTFLEYLPANFGRYV